MCYGCGIMRKLLYLLIAAAAFYGVVRYVPPETRQQVLAAVGLADFFQETMPGYLRRKLSIPENPVAKRERLLGELSAAIGGIGEELAAVAAPSEAPPPAAGPGQPAKPKPAGAPDLRARIEKSKELLQESEAVLAELERANPQQGFVAKAAERLLDKVLPLSPEVASGVGGNAEGTEICERR